MRDEKSVFVAGRLLRWWSAIERLQIACHHEKVSSRQLLTVLNLLASSPAYPHQAFRVGRSYGLQFHNEVSLELASEWAGVPAYAQSLEATLGPGALDSLLADVADHEDVTVPLARGLFGRWLEHVVRME